MASVDETKVLALAVSRGLVSAADAASAASARPGAALGALVAAGRLRAAEVPALWREVSQQGRTQTFGPWRLEQELGRGSFGVVYRATRDGWPEPVALKVLLAADDPELVARFRLESAIGRKLEHPGIVRALDAGELDGRPWFAMELVLGPSLAARLREGRVPHEEARALVARLARAIAHAHDLGVLHRDLKPANVLLDARTGWPRITDFGLARDRGLQATLTATGMSLGSPMYMAPEQLVGAKDLDARADIHALGVILYQALVGSAPYTGASVVEVADKLRAGRPAPPRALVPGIPAALEAVCLRALATRREERQQTARELADALEALGARPQARAARAARARGSGALVAGAILAASVVVLLLVGIGVATMIGRRPGGSAEPGVDAAPPPPPAAPSPRAVAAGLARIDAERLLAPWRAADGAWVRHRLTGWSDAVGSLRPALEPQPGESDADAEVRSTRSLVRALDALARGAEGPTTSRSRRDALAALDEAAREARGVDAAWRAVVELEVARLAFDRGRFAEARERAREVAKGEGRPALEAQFLAAMATLWIETYDAGVEALVAVHERDRGGLVGERAKGSYVRLVQVPEGQSRNALAAEALQAVLAREPDDVDARASLALALHGLARESRDRDAGLAAHAVVDEGLARAPDHLRLRYARLLLVARRHAESDVVLPAAVAVVRLIGVDPTQRELAELIGRACRRDATWSARLEPLARDLTPEERGWLTHMAQSGTPR